MRRHVRRSLLFALAVAAVTAVAGGVNAGATTAGDTYRNPVLNRDFPDPTVRLASDGWYYAYATEADPAGVHVNIQTARSRDLVHWTYLGEALPRLPAWGNKAQVSWAPDVVQ